MKRIFSILLITALLSTDMYTAIAAPELGATCKLEGQIARMPTGPLVCSKVGKVLKYVKGDAAIIDSGPIVKADKNVEATVLKAFNAYDHNACKGQHPHFTANYLVSPTYKPGMLKQQKVLFEQAMSCYDKYFSQPVVINVALVTESDYEFLSSQSTNGTPVFDDIKLRWAKFMMERLASGAGRFAGSAGWSVATNSAWVLMIDSSKSNVPDAHGAAHEFVHILQSYSKSGFFPFYGDGSTDADYINLPTWFWEGTAELFSYNAISSNAGIFSAEMTNARSQGKGSPSYNKISSTTDLISIMPKLEAPSDQQANMMFYALGSVECEYILATYGTAKYWQIMQNAGTYRDFNENLLKTIGISKAELYAKSAPFVVSQWRLSKF